MVNEAVISTPCQHGVYVYFSKVLIISANSRVKNSVKNKVKKRSKREKEKFAKQKTMWDVFIAEIAEDFLLMSAVDVQALRKKKKKKNLTALI